MSKPVVGDTVRTLDPSNNPCIALVTAVGTTTIDVVRGYEQSSGTFVWSPATGLTEVSDVASLTAGTWCRREVCG